MLLSALSWAFLCSFRQVAKRRDVADQVPRKLDLRVYVRPLWAAESTLRFKRSKSAIESKLTTAAFPTRQSNAHAGWDLHCSASLRLTFHGCFSRSYSNLGQCFTNNSGYRFYRDRLAGALGDSGLGVDAIAESYNLSLRYKFHERPPDLLVVAEVTEVLAQEYACRTSPNAREDLEFDWISRHFRSQTYDPSVYQTLSTCLGLPFSERRCENRSVAASYSNPPSPFISM